MRRISEPFITGNSVSGLISPCTDRRVDADRQVEVGAAEVDDPLEQVVDVQLELGAAAEGRRRLIRLIGNGDLQVTERVDTAGGRVGAVHGADHAAQLVAHGDGGRDGPARRLLQRRHRIAVAGVDHGHQQVAAVEVDGHGQVLAGQLGRDHALERRVDRRAGRSRRTGCSPGPPRRPPGPSRPPARRPGAASTAGAPSVSSRSSISSSASLERTLRSTRNSPSRRCSLHGVSIGRLGDDPEDLLPQATTRRISSMEVIPRPG